MTNEHDDAGWGTITLPRQRDRASQTDFLRELSLARRGVTVPSTPEAVGETFPVPVPSPSAVADTETPDAAFTEPVEAPWMVALVSATPDPAVAPPPAEVERTDQTEGPSWGAVATDAALSPVNWFDDASRGPAPQPIAPSLGLFDIMPVTTWPEAGLAEGRPWVDDPTDALTPSDPDAGATTATLTGLLDSLPATTWQVGWAPTEDPDTVDPIVETPDRPDVASVTDVRAPSEPAAVPALMVMPSGRPPVVTSAAPIAVQCSGLVASRIARGKRHTVLAGVDLTVRSGEVAVVTGRSGSGKTTLIECLAGLHRIDAGTVIVAETSIGDATDEQIADLRAATVGYVAQEPQLLADLSAMENIELPLLLSGWDVADARSEAEAAVALVRLQVPNHRTSELSAGERRRVAIARALVGEPAILWLDEASAAIDPDTMAGIYDLIFELCHDGLTVVAVTHDPVLLACANTTYELRNGSLHPVVA